MTDPATRTPPSRRWGILGGLVAPALVGGALLWMLGIPLTVRILQFVTEETTIPLMRSRDAFDTDFYIALVRDRTVLPVSLAIAAGSLLILTQRRSETTISTLRSPTFGELRRSLDRIAVWIAISLVVLAGVGLHTSGLWITDKGNDYDAAMNVEQALIRAGALEGAPDNYRDPLVPMLLSLQFRFDPRLDSFGVDEIERPGRHQLPLKQHNNLVMLVGLGVLGLIARMLIADRLLAFGAWIATTLYAVRFVLPSLVDSNMSEPHAFTLLALTSWLFLAVAKGHAGIMTLLLTGAALGLLTLVKGSFLLPSLVFILLFCLLHFTGMRGSTGMRGGVGRTLGLIVAGVLLVHLPFAIERATLDQGLLPSSRGAMVLAIRAAYTDLTPDDWLAILAQGGPLPIEAYGLDRDDLDRIDGRGSRTNWKRSDFLVADRQAQGAGRPEEAHSYYSQGVGQCIRLGGGSECQRWALEVLTSDWRHFLRMTAAVYWSEFWFLPQAPVSAVLNLFIQASVHVALLAAIIRRRADIFALAALPVALLAFHALTIGPLNLTRNGVTTSALGLLLGVWSSSVLIRRATRGSRAGSALSRPSPLPPATTSRARR